MSSYSYEIVYESDLRIHPFSPESAYRQPNSWPQRLGLTRLTVCSTPERHCCRTGPRSCYAGWRIAAVSRISPPRAHRMVLTDGESIPSPTLMPRNPDQYPEELWGIEDPRITFIPELQQYAVAYTSYSKGDPGVISRPDERLSKPLSVTGSLCRRTTRTRPFLPYRIDGLWALVHRPMTPLGAHIWISYSPDLRHWGGHRIMMKARKGASSVTPIRSACLSPPIETDRGWLMLYHGVKHTGPRARSTGSASLFLTR